MRATLLRSSRKVRVVGSFAEMKRWTICASNSAEPSPNWFLNSRSSEPRRVTRTSADRTRETSTSSLCWSSPNGKTLMKRWFPFCGSWRSECRIPNSSHGSKILRIAESNFERSASVASVFLMQSISSDFSKAIVLEPSGWDPKKSKLASCSSVKSSWFW